MRPGSSAAITEYSQPGIICAWPSPRPWTWQKNRSGLVAAPGRSQILTSVASTSRPSAAAAKVAPSATAAARRGLYRDAAQLHKNAAASGNPRAAIYLSHSPACLSADPRPAHWVAANAALDDPAAVIRLLDSLRKAGAHEQAAALAGRPGRPPGCSGSSLSREAPRISSCGRGPAG